MIQSYLEKLLIALFTPNDTRFFTGDLPGGGRSAADLPPPTGAIIVDLWRQRKTGIELNPDQISDFHNLTTGDNPLTPKHALDIVRSPRS